MDPHEYLEHNLVLLREMKALAEAQIPLIREERLEEALALGARSRRIEHQVGENARRCRLLLREHRGRPADARSEALTRETEKALLECRRLNGEIETLLLRKREDLLDGILQLRKAQQAVHRYGANLPRRPRFVQTLG